jgi:hypothetical protein
MIAIFKYQFKEKIEMYENAIILSVHEQNDDVFMWVEVDTDKPVETRYFVLYGTGHRIQNESRKFIGTVHCAGGQFVWHIFETFKEE